MNNMAVFLLSGYHSQCSTMMDVTDGSGKRARPGGYGTSKSNIVESLCGANAPEYWV